MQRSVFPFDTILCPLICVFDCPLSRGKHTRSPLKFATLDNIQTTTQTKAVVKWWLTQLLLYVNISIFSHLISVVLLNVLFLMLVHVQLLLPPLLNKVFKNLKIVWVCIVQIYSSTQFTSIKRLPQWQQYKQDDSDVVWCLLSVSGARLHL